MDTFLSETFFDVESDIAVKLAKTTGIFADLFNSSTFWRDQAKKYNIPENNKMMQIKNEIRKINNTKNIPTHVICTHFESPHALWYILDVNTQNDLVHILYRSERTITFISYSTTKRVEEPEQLYEGMITRSGILGKKTSDFFHEEHPRAFKRLEQKSIKNFNIDAIHYCEYIIEKTFPFKVIYWQNDIFDFEIQRKLQYLGIQVRIEHIFISKILISIIYYCERSKCFKIGLYENDIWVENIISLDFKNEDVNFSLGGKFWCFR